MTWLHVVLSHILVYQAKLGLIINLRISFVAMVVNPCDPVGDKTSFVSIDEAGDPGLTHRLLGYLGRKILDHISCRRESSLCKTFNESQKLQLLLWAEFLLLGVLDLSWLCLALVPSGRCRPHYTMFGGYFCMREIFSWFQRFNFINCGLNWIHTGGVVACLRCRIWTCFGVPRASRARSRQISSKPSVRAITKGTNWPAAPAAASHRCGTPRKSHRWRARATPPKLSGSKPSTRELLATVIIHLI
jgi:hypothetical protein